MYRIYCTDKGYYKYCMKSKPRFGTLKAAFALEKKNDAEIVLKHLRMLEPTLEFKLADGEVEDATIN